MELLIGIDIGTTCTKGGIFSAEGELIGQWKESYPLNSDECPGAATSKPQDWWKAVRKVLRNCALLTSGGTIRGIAIGSHGPSLVALDEKGRPVRSSLLWMDRRAVKEAELIAIETGSMEDPAWYMPKALWIKNHEPDIFKKIRWFLQPLDYINFLLTGKITASLASEHIKPWKENTIRAAGIQQSLFPPYTLMGNYLGEVSAVAACSTGIPAGTPVFAGTGGADFVEVLIGTATLEVGRVCDRGGTSQGVNLCAKHPIPGCGLFCAPHPLVQDLYHLGGLMSTTGKALQWYKEIFYGKRTSYEALLSKAAASPPGARGLMFLPWLSGIRTPWWDPLAQGVFLGMDLQHREEDFIRAIIEGVALGINQMIRIFTSHGAEPTEIRSCGGQSRSGLWNQIKADVTGMTVKIPQLTDGEILGMALLAGKGAGIFTDIKDSAERLVKISREYVPDPENHRFYARLQEVYEALYQPLKASFAHLSSLKAHKRDGAHTEMNGGGRRNSEKQARTNADL